MSRTIRLGLLGLGTVGSAVAEILARDGERLAERIGAELKIARAAVRNVKRKRSGAARRIKCTSDIDGVIAADDVDVVVELAGGIDPARSWIERA
ncbi:MAG: homoserine dehydrogenase, partial [Myxococcota bacterium]